MNFKEIKENPSIFRYMVKKHYDQHVEGEKPFFTWHGELLELQEYIEDNILVKTENFVDSHSLDGNEDHVVYNNSILEEHAVTDNRKKIIEILKRKFGLKYVEINKMMQKPGNFVAPHVDHKSSFISRCPFDFTGNELKKFIIFVTPWKMGQVWMVGNEAITCWKKFSVIEFPWYMPHATANTSTFDRQTISVSGISNTI
tara:strand:- start:83 stop:682 length:600 start_codon:yes stop_codon:yes gene_type:complete